MILYCTKIIEALLTHKRTLVTLAIIAASIESFGQCGTTGLTANPTATSGCGQTITYSFTAPPGMVGSPSWETSGNEQPSDRTGSTVTVTWAGASGTRYVRVRYGVFENNNVVERCSEKSYTITTGNPGTITSAPTSVCAGGSGTFTHSGSSGGTIAWQRCTSGCSTTSDTGWSAHPDNTFSNLYATTSFRVKLTSSCGVSYSNTRTVSVEEPPSAGSMSIIQGLSQYPSTGGAVQFELTGYSSNANLIRWQMQVAGGAWQDLNGGFQQGHHRYPLAGTHSVSQTTSFRALAKSSSNLGCESIATGIALQTITISGPPPPAPSPSVQGPTQVCRDQYYTYSLTDANYNVTLFQTSWTITGPHETIPVNTSNQHSIQVKWTSGTTGRVSVEYHNSQYTGTRSLDVTLPDPPVITLSPSSVCSGETVTLSSTGGTFIEFQWALVGTENWTSMTGNSVTVYNSLKFRSRAGIANCAEEFSSPKTVSVESRPSAGSMDFIVGNAQAPYNGGGVQFELTSYSTNANLIRWQKQVSGGSWQDLNNGFQEGHHRYPLAGTHFVSENTVFRAIAKSSSSLGCESESPGIAMQTVTLSDPPPPPPSPDLSGPTNDVCKEVFHTYTLADSDQDITGTFQTSWEITGDSYTVDPSDYQSRNLYSIQVKWLLGSIGSVKVSYHSIAHNIEGSDILNVSLLTPGALTITASPGELVCTGGSVILTASGGSQYNWTGPGIANPVANPITINPTVASQYQVTGIEPVCDLEKSVVKEIEVLPLPATPISTSLTYCNWQQQELKIESEFKGSYNWYSANGEFLGNGIILQLPASYSEGTSQYQAEAVDFYGCISPGRATITVNVTSGNCDDKLNWIETRGYDKNGIISHSKEYFDYEGKSIQSQSFSFQGTSSHPGPKIFLSQSLRDRYDRPVGSTLSAPSALTSFKYEPKFAWSNNNKPYGYKDIDDPNNASTVLNPLPVNDETPGTLGWYYSSNNTWEQQEYIPKTDYPYSRIEFYDDGSGDVRRSALPGDQHRLGANHEVLQGSFPVFSELNDYVTKRIEVLGIGTGNLQVEAIQSVVRDENGHYAISISDKSGNNIMSCRPGTRDENVLEIFNSINASGDPASASDYKPMTYFYILNDQAVTITGSTDYVVENIITNERKAAGATFAGDGDGVDDDDDGTVDNEWPAGFYRIILVNKTSVVTIQYRNFFLDVSYNIYDDAGRLRASVSPNGYIQWKQTPYVNIDKTAYTYNHRGQLLSMDEPDGGTTRYLYRNDGNIRFSQNAKQLADNTFSYTNYDHVGRAQQSGEYTGGIPFNSLTAQLEYETQVDFLAQDPSHTKDWIITYYDKAPPELPGVTFDQQFIRGVISSTKNRNMQTWYSYDEFGKIVKMVQKPAHLNMHFLTEYGYDFLGNVKTVKTSRHVATPIAGFQNIFYHHYEYDADQRLSKAYTSTDGSNKKLRATYEYYLHGPLKRIELGTNIQGVDFVYNIHGWLTQINDPDANEDPGKDGSSGDNAGVRPDAFAMELNYYESNLGALYSANASPSLHDLHQLHGLSTPQQQLANHQPLIRFNPMENIINDEIHPPAFKKYSAEGAQYKQMLLNGKINKK